MPDYLYFNKNISVEIKLVQMCQLPMIVVPQKFLGIPKKVKLSILNNSVIVYTLENDNTGQQIIRALFFFIVYH